MVKGRSCAYVNEVWNSSVKERSCACQSRLKFKSEIASSIYMLWLLWCILNQWLLMCYPIWYIFTLCELNWSILMLCELNWYIIHAYFKSHTNYLNVLCILSCMHQNGYKDQLCTRSPWVYVLKYELITLQTAITDRPLYKLSVCDKKIAAVCTVVLALILR